MNNAKQEQDQKIDPRWNQLSVGDSISIGGVLMRVVYINRGKRRITFSVKDDNVKMPIESRDPYLVKRK